MALNGSSMLNNTVSLLAYLGDLFYLYSLYSGMIS